MKTYTPVIDPQAQTWVVVDAANVPLGRLATVVATHIRGKHRADYTPNILMGDFVIVLNAEKVALTGKKLDQKVYTRYTGYQGGLKKETARTALAKHPERVIEHAVYGMLPKGRLGRAMHTRLKVYPGSQHPHTAQAPVALTIKSALENK
ncbi:50S ribosomal protein L13 [Deinococcus ruber]|uniref:Large ribosomal subunit protein uL13 n=1 Tax=Deinococcus ruber TaxID=1848197 RepID=A0A918FAQ0_9DEIO|nr:50S ribosomal protein L13 [Deinococcus ruber]GGR25280.1 50S ribosomal protein L13 [Deinococcus ruber]